MDNASKMFLLAAEEQNFTRAAERAHVTQQCLSSYIKRLEEELQVKLFERRPRLCLTPCGEALYESLRQVSVIEDDLQMRMREIRDGDVGHISFGVNSTRGRIFLPRLFDEYHSLFPKVTMSVVLDDTVNLAALMMNKKLDIFLGISCQPHDLLEFIPVKREPMYLVAANDVLRQYYAGSAPWHDLHDGDTVDLRSFKNLPLAGNPGSSTASTMIGQYLLSQNISFKRIVSIGDYDTQISLCGRGLAVMFCSLLILAAVMDYNTFKSYRRRLLRLHVRDFNDTLRVEIVRPKQLFRPRYLQCFTDMLKSRLDNYYARIEKSSADSTGGSG